MAEISNGMTSCADLSEAVRKYGIVLSEGQDDMELPSRNRLSFATTV